MVNSQEYETRALESWYKGIELRRKHRRNIWEVQAKGGLLVHGIGYFHGLLAGMGDFAFTELTPFFRALTSNPEELIKCHEASEVRGFNTDVCSSMRCHLGAYFRGFALRSPDDVRIKPDFCFQGVPCTALAKANQIYADLMGLPYFTLDVPFKENKAADEYQMAGLYESIEWLEKTTGREFDDEKLIEGVRNEWESLAYFARTLELNKVVPAPLDVRHLYAFMTPLFLARQQREVAEFYRFLLDEVKERVKDRISARGSERCRLIHGFFSPMYYMGIFKHPQQYGAVFVAADLVWYYALWDSLDFKNRHWEAAPLTPEEAGLPLRNREDALRVLVSIYSHRRPHLSKAEAKPAEFCRLAEDWHANAAVLHVDRGCKGLQAGMSEVKLALEKAGVPTLLYEASGYDPRDFTESQVLERFDAFLENLGLAKMQVPRREERTGGEELEVH